jgi:hypothetical protein
VDLLALGDAPVLLDALGALARAVRDSPATDVAEGRETTDASIDAIAASLDPAVAVSADVVGTGPKERKSPTGASTCGGCVAAATGVGAMSICETDVDWEGTVKVLDEPPETIDREAPNSLDLTAYRTTAIPTPAPRSMVRICS